MSEYVPGVWTFALLALASWRVWLLVADDKILEKPMDTLYRRLRPAERRAYWRDFVECPRCFGFWISVAWWVAWLIFPSEATIVAVPWAVSAVVALVESAHAALAEAQSD